MPEINPLNFIDKINKTLEIRCANRYFSKITLEFTELLFEHFNIIEHIKSICSLLTEEATLEDLDLIKRTLEKNCESIIKIIEETSERKIEVYYIENEDSVLEISKTFKSDAAEVYELNNLKKVYSLEGRRILLVPIKF